MSYLLINSSLEKTFIDPCLSLSCLRNDTFTAREQIYINEQLFGQLSCQLQVNKFRPFLSFPHFL